jgi:hypothetical protein
MSHSLITILEQVTQCNYPINVKDYIANVIGEMTTTDKSCKYFKINKPKCDKTTEIILALRLMIPTVFAGFKYDIPIVIYLPKTFPFSPPEIFIEKFSKDIEINANNKNVDPNSGRVITKGLATWNSYSSLPNIIKEINISFNEVFPVYQVKKEGEKSSPSSVSSTSPRSSGKFSPISTGQNVEPLNLAIKTELIQDIIKRVYNPIKEEIKYLQKESNSSQYFKQEYYLQNKKLSDYILNKDAALTYLQNLISNITKEYNYLKSSLDNFSDKKLTQDNFMKYVEVNADPTQQKILKLVAIEATLEDITNLVRKAFERQIIDFPNTVKLIRLITREIVKIKFLRDKEMMKIRK